MRTPSDNKSETNAFLPKTEIVDMPDSAVQVEHQRRYYAQTASQYDSLHLGNDLEHDVALEFLISAIHLLSARSILDIGAGTGRTICAVQIRVPETTVLGVEPVAELRQVAHEKGISTSQLIDGNGAALPFPDGAFDLVCAFAVLHHVPRPECVVREMLRVARLGIFISDSNNFGQGSTVARFVKQALHAVKLWKIADLIKTRGKGYTISQEDGLAYSYSVFDSVSLMRATCRRLHFMNTRTSGPNLYRTASHVAVLGVK